jgi:hypothetical protein
LMVKAIAESLDHDLRTFETQALSRIAKPLYISQDILRQSINRLDILEKLYSRQAHLYVSPKS